MQVGGHVARRRARARRRCGRARACCGRRSRSGGCCARSGRAAAREQRGAAARSGRSRGSVAARLDGADQRVDPAGVDAARARRRRRRASRARRRSRSSARPSSDEHRLRGAAGGRARDRAGRRRTLTASAVAPPMMPSRMRFGGKPAAAPGSSATIRIADTPASTTSSSRPPSAIGGAHGEDRPARPSARRRSRCSSSIRSATVMPSTTPPTSWIARPARSPLRGADGDHGGDRRERGRGSGSSRTARYHATTAAAAVCRIASMRPRKRVRAAPVTPRRRNDVRRTDHSTIDIRQAPLGFTSDCESCHSARDEGRTNARVLGTARGRGCARPRAARRWRRGGGPRDRRLPQRLARLDGPRPGDRAAARAGARTRRCGGGGRARGPRLRRRRPRHRPVLLRLRASASRAGTATRRSATATSSLASRRGARSPSWSRSRAPTSTSCGSRTTLGFVEAASLGCRFMTAFAAVTEHGRVARRRLGRRARLRRRRPVGADDRHRARRAGDRGRRRRRDARARPRARRRAHAQRARPGRRDRRPHRRRRPRLVRRARQRRHVRELDPLPAQARPPRPGRPDARGRPHRRRSRWTA